MAETSPLRRRMIEDMTVRNLSPATQRSYVHAVAKFSRFFGRSPDKLRLEDVRTFQVHLASKGVAWSSLNQTVAALRFFYGVTLGMAEVPERIAYAREPRRLPVVLSADEVVRFLEAVPSLKTRAALTTAYAAGDADRDERDRPGARHGGYRVRSPSGTPVVDHAAGDAVLPCHSGNVRARSIGLRQHRRLLSIGPLPATLHPRDNLDPVHRRLLLDSRRTVQDEETSGKIINSATRPTPDAYTAPILKGFAASSSDDERTTWRNCSILHSAAARRDARLALVA